MLSSVSPRGVWEKAVEEFVNRTSARVSVVRGGIVQSGSVKMADEQVRKMKIDVFSHNHCIFREKEYKDK